MKDNNLSRIEDIERKEIGFQLFDEITKILKQGDIIALLGPRMGGKGLVLQEVKSRIPENEFLVAELNWRKPTYYRGSDIISQLIKELKIEENFYRDIQDIRFQEKISYIIKEAYSIYGKKICFLVEGILNIPSYYARKFLTCLVTLSQFAGGGGIPISAAITGSADFLPLCMGLHSPLRHQKRFLTVHLEKEYSRKFFETSQISPFEIENDAFDYLYEQTSGSPHLIHSFVKAIEDENRFKEQKNIVPCTLSSVKEELEQIIEEALISDITLRALVQEIGHKQTDFDEALHLINAPLDKGIEISKISEIIGAQGDINDCLLRLEVSEFARISDDDLRVLFSSPVMAGVMKQMLNKSFVCDSYIAQGRWEIAWKEYEGLDIDLIERPISGPPRFRQRDLIPFWSDHLFLCAHKGTEEVLKEFVYGTKYLLGVDIAGLALIENEKIQWYQTFSELKTVPFLPIKSDYDREFNDEQGRIYRVLDNNGLWNQIICENVHFKKLEEHDTHPILILSKHLESSISHSEYEQLSRILDAFLTAYDYARGREYDKTKGKLRERHLRVLCSINRRLFEPDITMEKIAELTVKELIDTGQYLRIQISFVNEERTLIEDVPTSYCRFPQRSKYPLSHPEKDVLPWVVYHRKPAFIPDARIDPRSLLCWKEGDLTWNYNMARQIIPSIKSISIIPMVVGCLENPDDEIIGTIHFERKDQQLPPDYEKELMSSLAGQIAGIFHLTKILIPHERYTATLHSLGEFSHALAKTIPFALKRLSNALKSLPEGYDDVKNNILEAHDFISESMRYIRSVGSHAKGLLINKKEIKLYELIIKIEENLKQIDNRLIISSNCNDNFKDIILDIDFDNILQVFINLADNAIFHNEKTLTRGEKINLIIEALSKNENQKEVAISVRNTGISIPRDILRKIFEYGFSTHPRGKGIGLFSAKRILNAHDGDIIAEDIGDFQGASFLIILPYKNKEDSNGETAKKSTYM